MMKKGTSSGKVKKSNMDVNQNVKYNQVHEDWSPGEILWARLGRFPYWPCLVVVDPQKNDYTEKKETTRTCVILYHVQFLGDNGIHCWISANQLMKYEGKEKFLKLAEDKKKETKYASAFSIKRLSLKWNRSVMEAENLASQTRNERLLYLRKLFPLDTTQKKEVETKTKKAKMNSGNDNNFQKPSTSDGTKSLPTKDNKNKIREETNNKERDVPIAGPSSSCKKEESTKDDLHTLQSSSAVRKEDSSKNIKIVKKFDVSKDQLNSEAKSKVLKKIRKRKRQRKFVGKFDVFVDRLAHLFAEAYPEFKNDRPKLIRFMTAMWSDMTDEEKSPYCERYQEQYAELMGVTDTSLIF